MDRDEADDFRNEANFAVPRALSCSGFAPSRTATESTWNCHTLRSIFTLYRGHWLILYFSHFHFCRARPVIRTFFLRVFWLNKTHWVGLFICVHDCRNLVFLYSIYYNSNTNGVERLTKMSFGFCCVWRDSLHEHVASCGSSKTWQWRQWKIQQTAHVLASSYLGHAVFTTRRSIPHRELRCCWWLSNSNKSVWQMLSVKQKYRTTTNETKQKQKYK